MIYIDISDIEKKYESWREIEIRKQDQIRSEDLSYTQKDLRKIPTWDEWKKKADDATRQLIDEPERRNELIPKKETIYKEFKGFLKYLFHGKCAYCESKNERNDVDHYRPKNSVTKLKDQETETFIAGEGSPDVHPGYYWLAFNPENLMLSCETCNQEYKSSEFPISGIRACCPTDSLEAESPKLINPYKEKNPEVHFAINSISIGVIEGITPEGKETIKICGLNRLSLIDGRSQEWDEKKPSLLLRLLSKNEPMDFSDVRFSMYIRLRFEKLIHDSSANIHGKLFSGDQKQSV